MSFPTKGFPNENYNLEELRNYIRINKLNKPTCDHRILLGWKRAQIIEGLKIINRWNVEDLSKIKNKVDRIKKIKSMSADELEVNVGNLLSKIVIPNGFIELAEKHIEKDLKENNPFTKEEIKKITAGGDEIEDDSSDEEIAEMKKINDKYNKKFKNFQVSIDELKKDSSDEEEDEEDEDEEANKAEMEWIKEYIKTLPKRLTKKDMCISGCENPKWNYIDQMEMEMVEASNEYEEEYHHSFPSIEDNSYHEDIGTLQTWLEDHFKEDEEMWYYKKSDESEEEDEEEDEVKEDEVKEEELKEFYKVDFKEELPKKAQDFYDPCGGCGLWYDRDNLECEEDNENVEDSDNPYMCGKCSDEPKEEVKEEVKEEEEDDKKDEEIKKLKIENERLLEQIGAGKGKKFYEVKSENNNLKEENEKLKDKNIQWRFYVDYVWEYGEVETFRDVYLPTVGMKWNEEEEKIEEEE
tara:strand:+ start:91 stop:1488 length:1398 start_codon:yes stop_codon:yes gene_type:complete